MRAIYAFRPLDPSRHPAGVETRAPEILAAWLRRFPDSKLSDADPEDWIENACVVEAADAAGIALTLLENNGRGIMVSGGTWHVPEGRPDAPVGAMLGTWTKADSVKGLPIDMTIVGSDNRASRAAGTYASSGTFQRHAGRAVIPASADDVGQALRGIVDRQGHGRVFVKTTQKGWARRFDVDPASERDPWAQIVSADMALEEETDGAEGLGLAWFSVQHEGVPDVLIAQGLIEPTYEYRVVVIDGRPVTASGCIEAFTPAENEAVFDPKMEQVRNDGDVVTREDLAVRYIAFARAFCNEFAAERGPGLDYALDLCIDAATGAIVPIELNPAMNLGMYARSTHSWLAAIVERTERVAARRSA